MTNREAKKILEEIKTIDDSIYQYDPLYLMALDVALDALKHPVIKWIPCNQTIEIPDHEVLSCDKYGNMLIGYLAYIDEQWLCESNSEMLYGSIAWAEMPLPYKEEKE